MKKLCMLLALLLLLSLAACGGGQDETPDTPAKQPEAPSATAAPETPAAPEAPEAAPEAPAEDEPAPAPEASGPKTLAECRSQLLAYYVEDGTTYFVCAVEKLAEGRVKTVGMRVGGKPEGWTLTGATENWMIYFPEDGFSGEVPLSDIQLHMSASNGFDEEERDFGDWGAPAAAETYPEYGVFPVGAHYALFGTGTLTVWSDQDYVDLAIETPNLFLDGREQLAPEDLTPEMFDVCAADGTPLAEVLGVPAEYAVLETPYGLKYRARLGGEGGALVREDLEAAIRETAAYYVYHGPDGNDYTVACDFEE